MTTDPTGLPPLLAAASALELDRDAASSGESNDYRRGMTRAVKLLRMLNDEEPAAVSAAVPQPQVPEPLATLLATPCATCDHTLNWHRHHVGCIVSTCGCGRFEEQPDAEAAEADLTAEQQVRGVQAWMALDLHQALGWPVDHGATVVHQGRKSWSDWWAELLAGVRNVQMMRRYRGEVQAPAAVSAAVAPPTNHTALSDREKAMLSFALEIAQEEIHARSLDITDQDKAALVSLRRMADETATETPAPDDRRLHACTQFGTWFDRSICAEPCGAMHTRCTECGVALDTCPQQPAAGARQDGGQS